MAFGFNAEVAPQLFFAAPVVWCFAAIGILAVIIDRGKGAPLSFAFSLLGWSFVGASAGLYYRKHYFILLLPAVCLLAGTAMKCLADRIARRAQLGRPSVVPAALFAVGYLASLYTQRAEFFLLSPAGVIRHQYGGNPFPEAIEFGRYIREHSEAGAQVAVLGSEPEIYFYAARHSATGYIYTYGLMEEQRYASRMQQEMMDEIEKAKPEYLVTVVVPTSWLRKPNSDTAILYWTEKYISEEYRAVGVAEIGMTTNYRWEGDASGYIARSKYSMYLYKRRF